MSILAFLMLLVGCSDTDTNQALSGTEVLAEVNGDSISFNQLKTELNSMQLDSHADISVKGKLLSKMIDRQLLAQEANKLNLDRVPDVVEAVNSAKSQIYAQAYLTNRLSKLPEPSAEEITKFIDEHPETCGHRKVLFTKDIVFNYDPTLIDLKLLQASVTDIDSLQSYLASNNIPYNIFSGHFSMDTLPSAWVEKLKTVNIGNLLFAHDNTKVIAKSITSITENPMSAEEAKNFATKVLSENKKQQFITNEVARLRKLSKINILDSNMALTNKTLSNATVDHSTGAVEGL